MLPKTQDNPKIRKSQQTLWDGVLNRAAGAKPTSAQQQAPSDVLYTDGMRMLLTDDGIPIAADLATS